MININETKNHSATSIRKRAKCVLEIFVCVYGMITENSLNIISVVVFLPSLLKQNVIKIDIWMWSLLKIRPNFQRNSRKSATNLIGLGDTQRHIIDKKKGNVELRCAALRSVLSFVDVHYHCANK